jgi:putative ABC transport system ATP-binding protein
VLHGVDIAIRGGELTLIMGPSGSGKTTLISILAGLLRPTAGDIELCGQPISRFADGAVAEVRRRSLGFVFQTSNLFAALTALDNVAEPLCMHGLSLAEARHRAAEVLDAVGLGERLGHRPGELSGGQKQRVAIARAIAARPAMVIGDEPTAALDKTASLDVMGLLRRHVAADRSVLIVTHDHRLESFADRVIELEDGRIVNDRRGDWRPKAEEEIRRSQHETPNGHVFSGDHPCSPRPAVGDW